MILILVVVTLKNVTFDIQSNSTHFDGCVFESCTFERTGGAIFEACMFGTLNYIIADNDKLVINGCGMSHNGITGPNPAHINIKNNSNVRIINSVFDGIKADGTSYDTKYAINVTDSDLYMNNLFMDSFNNATSYDPDTVSFTIDENHISAGILYGSNSKITAVNSHFAQQAIVAATTPLMIVYGCKLDLDGTDALGSQFVSASTICFTRSTK